MAVADPDIRSETTVFPEPLFHVDGETFDDSGLLKKLLLLMRDLVSIYDLEAEQIVYKNRSLSLLLGYTNYGAQVDEKTIFQVLLHPDDFNTVRAQFEAVKLAADGVVMEMTYRLQHSNGLWRLFAEQQMVYKRNSEGAPTQILRLVRDITEEHETSLHLQSDNAMKIAELEQASAKLTLEREMIQSVSHFIGATAHELRTPLTIINTSLYLLKKISDPVKQAERLQIIENQVAQLSRLISQMHMVMRLDSLSQLAESKPVTLPALFAKLEQELGGAAAKKELAFQINQLDDLPPVYGDADLVLTALRNVLENAILYTDNGTITAQASNHDHEVIVSIRDTGPGISIEDVDHIFERFYKIEKDKRSNRVAAGLGLAITRRIMELHGGKVTVESQLGQGSTFYLIWPI